MLALAAGFSAVRAEATLCGDADGDGSVTITDGVNVLRAAAGLSSTCDTACDVDGSGDITISDGVNVLRVAAGLPSACSMGAVSLTACTTITGSGRYTVDADLQRGDLLSTVDEGPCLDIENSTDLVLDCGGHAIRGQPAISIQHTMGFRIEHCQLIGTGDADVLATPALTIQGGTAGVLTGNTFGPAYVDVADTNDLTVTNNQFDGIYRQRWSSGLHFTGNTMKSPYTSMAAPSLVISSYGAHNEIVDNTMDGNWDGVRSPQDEVGSDDGIILQDENDDHIANNIIRNVFDCGIETVGLISDSSIEGNDIANAAFCGIGGWYWNGLRGTTVASNSVNGATALFWFYRIYGLRAAETSPEGTIPADTAVYFENNVFAGNRFTPDPDLGSSSLSSSIPLFTDLGYAGSLSDIPTERVPGPDDFVLTNNVFRDNDFGTTLDAPYFGNGVVPGYVIDGGGNVCRSPSTAYPLGCSPTAAHAP